MLLLKSHGYDPVEQTNLGGTQNALQNPVAGPLAESAEQCVEDAKSSSNTYAPGACADTGGFSAWRRPCKARRALAVRRILLVVVLGLLNSPGARADDGDVCASSPCQHHGACTEVIRPAVGHRRRMQSKGCSLSAMGATTALINQECCGDDDKACSEKGVPTSCDAGCAQVFLPFWERCGQLFDDATYGPVAQLCQAVPPPPRCDMSTIAAQSAEVDRQCCSPADAACADGVPSSCDSGCAAVFLPFWSSCGSMFDATTYAPVVAMCESPTPTMEVDFACSCVSNWQGDRCEQPRDPCDSWSCGTYGSCSNGVCTCPPGASGPHCEDDPCRHVATAMLVDERSGTVYPCVHGTCQGGACACEANWGGENCARWVSMTVSPPAECDFMFPCAVRYPELPPPPPPPRGPMQCCRTCNCDSYCDVLANPGCGVGISSPVLQPGTGDTQDVCGAYCFCAPGMRSWGCVDDDAPECQPGGSLNVC
jgi:hypothetical protein